MEWLVGSGYGLSRLLFVRATGLVVLLAFANARNQFRPLLGEHGLLPVPRFTARVRFRDAPSLFHLRYSDRMLAVTSWVGMALAALVVAGIAERAPLWAWMLLWLTVWVLYQSIVNVGQIFYGFGWESLLLEVVALTVFIGPSSIAAPIPVIFLLRWLLFRLEFGAGLIKIRGDRCWRDLTCLYYHHETQPMPNPLSWWFHNLPRPLHRIEVAANHAAQLVVPFGLFLPQPGAAVAGMVIVVTQLWLVASGNFSWLNALAIVLAFAAFDDRALEAVLPLTAPAFGPAPLWHRAWVVALVALVVLLSYWPVRNMISSGQLMNASFNRLHFVNTYGAFGSITRTRYEVVLEGTTAGAITPDTEWREYAFKGKPGDIRRRPRQVAPYHLRLDWLMWFAAISPGYGDRWLVPLCGALLRNDAGTVRLLAHNPFATEPPRFVRARYYRYRFASEQEHRETGAWWARDLVDEYLPPIARKDVT